MRRAAEEYQVPHSTLHDRVSGKVQFGAKSGPRRDLNDQEESEPVNFVVVRRSAMREHGFRCLHLFSR